MSDQAKWPVETPRSWVQYALGDLGVAEAAWGLAEAKYLRAVSCLLDLDSSINVDLVRIEEAKPALRRCIESEGKVI